jgi:polyhydroxybutyrate depolymerase
MTDDASQPLTTGDQTVSLDMPSPDGSTRTRTALVHVPPGYDHARDWPLVLAFHGGGTNSHSMRDFSGLDEKADEAGFVVVYPDGTGRLNEQLTWNGGNCCGYALRYGIDDVAYASALLEELMRRGSIDARRVYATGMSNGAMMAYRLAAELSTHIAAIAPVGGPLGLEHCQPTRPVSVIHFHGTADEFAPYEGGKGIKSLSKARFHSVEHSIRVWIELNGCPSQPERTQLTKHTSDAMYVVRDIYSPGKQGSEVVLYTIEGGGHTWPGRQSEMGFLGPSTLEISANDLMWDFFMRHPLE